MTFHSHGMCRLLDNVFQSIRGSVIARYGIDPRARFNLFYTFGRTAIMNGKYYRPHHALFSEINRAQESIDLCLFLIGELRGEYSILIVTHNMQQASRISDYTALMYLGRLLEYGPTSDIFTRPKLRETEDYVTGRFG